MKEWMIVTEILLKLEKNIDKIEGYIINCNLFGNSVDSWEVLKLLKETKEIAAQGEDYSKEQWM